MPRDTGPTPGSCWRKINLSIYLSTRTIQAAYIVNQKLKIPDITFADPVLFGPLGSQRNELARPTTIGTGKKGYHGLSLPYRYRAPHALLDVARESSFNERNLIQLSSSGVS